MKRKRIYLTLLSTLMIAAFGISLASCGGGDDGGAPPPPPVTYSQADLTGTWHFNKLDAGTADAAKWDRGKIDIDNTGLMTFPVYESSKIGDTAPTGLVITIHSATGIVSITDFPAFRGVMSTNKKIIVATIKEADAPSMLVLQKADPAATFTSADLASKSFMYQHIKAGFENDWEYGFGTTDPSGAVTLTSIYRPDPATGEPIPMPGTPVIMGNLLIDSGGIVTLDTNTTMRGVMSSDKKSMVITETGGGVGTESYTLTIVQITGQTFTQADLTGAWNFGMLAASATSPGWLYGTASVNASGAVAFPAWTQIGSGQPPTGVAFTLGADGILLEPASTVYNPSTHGAMSFGKDFVVLTTTMDASSGVYALAVMVRGTQAIVQDAAAMNPIFDTLESLYATTPSPTDLDNWFATHVSLDFLMDGMDGTTLLTALKAGEGPQVGMTLTAAIDRPIDVSAVGYGKGYDITLWHTSALGITESLPTKVVFDGTRWRWYGNQQWTEARVRPRAEKSVQSNGTTTYTTWLEPEVNDNTLYAYNLGVRSAVVVGPGLPAAGVGIDIYGSSGNMYQLMDDNVISGIPNYAEYTIALCSESAAAIVTDPSLCTPLQTYTYAIGKRPLTNAEALVALYPALTLPTDHNIAYLTDNWATGIPISWTNPPQMQVEWAGLVWPGDSAQNENLTGVTSTTLTVSGSAPTSATLYMGGLDSDGRIFSLIWGFGP